MATLKISDLSVGDWVRTKDGNVTVDIISPLEVVVMNDYGNLCACKIEDIEPIPITAEILEKNGVVKNNEYLHTIALENSITLGVRTQSDGYLFELKREKRRIGELLGIFRGIYNIHQLQHAIRLAGVDKEINL